MSGIFGVILLDGSFKDALNKERMTAVISSLAESNQIRGSDATGIAATGKDDIRVLKHGITAKEFVKSAKYKKFMDSVNLSSTHSFIGHCRSAGRGAAKDNKNNSPIVAGDVIGVHDGDINNNATLFECYKEYITMTGDVNNEIVFKLFNHWHTSLKKPFSDTIKQINEVTTGTSAYAAVSAKAPTVTCLVRGKGNPLEVKLYTESGLIIFSSSEFHLDAAAKAASMTLGTKVPLTLGKALVICAKKNEYKEVTVM